MSPQSDGMKVALFGHDERLQSLRGLAAFSVMVGHASLLLPPTPFSIAQGTLFEQNSAVVFFYVLSGFVLSESLRRGGSMRSFGIRRLGRLLPVFWSSVALGTIAAIAMRHAPIAGASAWYNGNFLGIGTSARDIALNVLGLSTTINGALWSIQVELFLIPILPLAVIVTDRLSNVQNLFALIVLCLISDGMLLPISFAHPNIRPIVYLYCFYAGLLIPRVLSSANWCSFAQNGKVVTIELIAAAVLHLLCMHGLFTWQTKFVCDALISAHLIAYVVSSPSVTGILRHHALVRLGDCSYSFYAYGQIILVSVAFAQFRLSPTPWWDTEPTLFTVSTLGGALMIALPLAYASYRWIELSGIELARMLSRSRGTVARTTELPTQV
jgi:peptidoglycan/LPS O-acetylase OafA/YrhL